MASLMRANQGWGSHRRIPLHTPSARPGACYLARALYLVPRLIDTSRSKGVKSGKGGIRLMLLLINVVSSLHCGPVAVQRWSAWTYLSTTQGFPDRNRHTEAARRTRRVSGAASLLRQKVLTFAGSWILYVRVPVTPFLAWQRLREIE